MNCAGPDEFTLLCHRTFQHSSIRRRSLPPGESKLRVGAGERQSDKKNPVAENGHREVKRPGFRRPRVGFSSL